MGLLLTGCAAPPVAGPRVTGAPAGTRVPAEPTGPAAGSTPGGVTPGDLVPLPVPPRGTGRLTVLTGVPERGPQGCLLLTDRGVRWALVGDLVEGSAAGLLAGRRVSVRGVAEDARPSPCPGAVPFLVLALPTPSPDQGGPA